jgi:vacuolar-type H+-ATPase subunit I/STV1
MKPLAIIGMLCVIGSSVIGFLNRKTFIDTRKSKDAYNRQILNNFDKSDDHNTIALDETTKFKDLLKSFNSDKFSKESEESETVKSAEKDKAALAEAETVQKQIDAINNQIADKLKDFGGKPEELSAKRDSLKADVDTLTNQLSVTEKDIGVVNEAVAENSKTATRYVEQQTARAKSISLGQRTGTINAVNPDWAFCIVNMGKKDGVSTDSRLLVKRGAQLVGKLNISQIQDGQTMCDIDLKSLKGKDTVQPGDEVIFDNAN